MDDGSVRLERCDLNIQEIEEPGDVLRLVVTGELDLATSPVLAARLAEPRRDRQLIRLDLSGVSFIDCSGIRVLVEATRASVPSQRDFSIDPEVAPAVRRVLALVDADRLLLG
jgi:anti-sigma B factor antagonist